MMGERGQISKGDSEKMVSKGKGNSRECDILAVIQREGNDQLCQMLLTGYAK